MWQLVRLRRPHTVSLLLSSSTFDKVAGIGAPARTARSCSSRSRAVMEVVVTTSTTAAVQAHTAGAGAGTRARAGREAMVAVATTAAVGVDTMAASSNVAGAAATTVFSVANRLRGVASRPHRLAIMDTWMAAMVNSSSRVAMAASSRATAMANRASASPHMVSSHTASSLGTAGARMAKRRHTIRAVAQVVLRVGAPMVAVAAATAAAAVAVVGTRVALGGGTATTRTGQPPWRAGAVPWQGRRPSCCGEVADEVDAGGSNTRFAHFCRALGSGGCFLLALSHSTHRFVAGTLLQWPCFSRQPVREALETAQV